jgi:hypothetical protein
MYVVGVLHSSLVSDQLPGGERASRNSVPCWPGRGEAAKAGLDGL